MPLTARPGASRRGESSRRAGPIRPPASAATETHYQLLGVSPAATRAEIDRAYRALMKTTHPDRHRLANRGAAEEAAKRLNQAYATLVDPLKRQAYDRSIRADLIQDELMSRYVGGFYVPQGDNTVDPLAQQFRRERTAAERHEQSRANRDALLSILFAFGGATLAVIAFLVLWAIARALLGVVF